MSAVISGSRNKTLRIVVVFHAIGYGKISFPNFELMFGSNEFALYFIFDVPSHS